MRNIFFAAAFFVAGCTTAPKQEAPVEPAKVVAKLPALAWSGKHVDAEMWTESLVSYVPKLMSGALEVVPVDYRTFCPNFPKLDKSGRVLFYAHLVSKMAQFESGYKPATTYTESFNDARGKPVISRGLLQISIESANSYGCGFTDAQELHRPYLNIACGLRILDRWIARDGTLAGYNSSIKKWQGGARYWSVLRDLAGKDSYPAIVKYLNGLSICK